MKFFPVPRVGVINVHVFQAVTAAIIQSNPSTSQHFVNFDIHKSRWNIIPLNFVINISQIAIQHSSYKLCGAGGHVVVSVLIDAWGHQECAILHDFSTTGLV